MVIGDASRTGTAWWAELLARCGCWQHCLGFSPFRRRLFQLQPCILFFAVVAKKSSKKKQMMIKAEEEEAIAVGSKNSRGVCNHDGNGFRLFPHLHEDLKVSILGYIADAPFETLPRNYDRSSLTHVLPRVSRNFNSLSQSDCYWKHACIRQVQKEPFLWQEGLRQMIAASGGTTTKNSTTASTTATAAIAKNGSPSSAGESPSSLVERAHRSLVDSSSSDSSLSSSPSSPASYKALYKEVVSKHLRFTGPVFFMSGHVQLGHPYTLHMYEPIHRSLIREVMATQTFPEFALSGGRVESDKATFVHANRIPSTPTTPAVLVQVLQCRVLPDGRSDVTLLPVAHVWLEKLWTAATASSGATTTALRSGDDSNDNDGVASSQLQQEVHYARCLRMGKKVSQDMNKLARQEALVSVVDRLTAQFEQMIDNDDDEEEESDSDSDAENSYYSEDSDSDSSEYSMEEEKEKGGDCDDDDDDNGKGNGMAPTSEGQQEL